MIWLDIFEMETCRNKYVTKLHQVALRNSTRKVPYGRDRAERSCRGAGSDWLVPRRQSWTFLPTSYVFWGRIWYRKSVESGSCRVNKSKLVSNLHDTSWPRGMLFNKAMITQDTWILIIIIGVPYFDWRIYDLLGLRIGKCPVRCHASFELHCSNLAWANLVGNVVPSTSRIPGPRPESTAWTWRIPRSICTHLKQAHWLWTWYTVVRICEG